MYIDREILETVGDRLLGEGAMSQIRRRLATVRVHNEHEVTITQGGTERRGKKPPCETACLHQAEKSTTLRSHTCSVNVHRRASVLRVRHWCT